MRGTKDRKIKQNKKKSTYDSNMLNSMVNFICPALEVKYLFWGKVGPEN